MTKYETELATDMSGWMDALRQLNADLPTEDQLPSNLFYGLGYSVMLWHDYYVNYTLSLDDWNEWANISGFNDLDLLNRFLDKWCAPNPQFNTTISEFKKWAIKQKTKLSN